LKTEQVKMRIGLLNGGADSIERAQESRIEEPPILRLKKEGKM